MQTVAHKYTALTDRRVIMKKKVVSLGLVVVLSLSVLVGCNSKESTWVSKDGYQYVSASETVKIAKGGSGHVLDVREWDNYEEGRIIDSQWCPIFPLEDETLAEEMTTYAKENLNDGEKIYIICNSGQRGAQKATEVLTEAGIDASLIYTVDGGAKALGKEKNALTTDRSDENIEWQYVTGEEALENQEAQIIDVRDDENYNAGHLKGSIQSDLTDFDDPKAQSAMYDLAVEKLDKEKPVYFLCYSGNKCAKAGVSVLKDAGFDVDNLYIIKDGAKGAAVQGAFVQE